MPPRPGPAPPDPAETSHAARGATVFIPSLQKGKLEEPKPSQNLDPHPGLEDRKSLSLWPATPTTWL